MEMADARRSEAWDHTAELLAQQANVWRDHKKRPRPYTSADFHPFHKSAERGMPVTATNIQMLKKVFVDARKA